jgi:TonB family protein
MLEPVELVPGATLDTTAQDKALEEKTKLAEKELENPTTDATQIVDVPRPAVEVPPDDADFLAEYDSKVEKQTAHRGKPADIVTPGATGPDQRGVLAPQPEVPPAVPPTESSPGKLGMRGPASQGKAGGSEIASATGNAGSPDGLVPEEGGSARKRGLGVAIDPTSPGGGGGGGGGDGRQGKAVDLRPGAQEAIARSSGGSYDKLDDIDEGAETLLNTKRFKYASFFNRIKRAVWENWHADRVYSMRDPDGKIYGIKDRLTVLKVSLHPDGRLANVIVEQPCGVDFLDDEAVSAFRKAAPFPNPPKGLVDQASQLITFRFGFTLEIQDRPSWKIVKYQ